MFGKLFVAPKDVDWAFFGWTILSLKNRAAVAITIFFISYFFLLIIYRIMLYIFPSPGQ